MDVASGKPLLVVDLVSPEQTFTPRLRRRANATKPAATEQTDRKRICCPICMECIFERRAASTSCGHLFCHECILWEIELRPKCPMCAQALTPAQVIPIYGGH